MAKLIGIVVLSFWLSMCFHVGPTWVGGGFPRRHQVEGKYGLPRHTHFLWSPIGRSSMARPSRIQRPAGVATRVGDNVYYAWAQPIDATDGAIITLGDHGIVVDILPDDGAMKIQWLGRYEGRVSYVPAAAMRVEDCKDEMFRKLDRDSDGILSCWETERVERIRLMVPAIDLDQDGRIDRGEWLEAEVESSLEKEVLNPSSN